MRFQSIGEALKNIDKKERDFLLQVADKTTGAKSSKREKYSLLIT